MKTKAAFATLMLAGLVLAAPAGAITPTQFDTVVAQIQAANYQPNYVPTGFDSAFAPVMVLNTAPAQDYTSGSVPGDPDHPDWPTPAFKYVRYLSADGAPLRARVALQPTPRPGIVVVHGFNTNGKESVIRWAAMLYANGYNVIASDQRDYKDEYQPSMPPMASDGYPNWLQTFGWKEAQDVVAAGNYLKTQAGVTSIGVVGFSEGAQNTVLALANDTTGIFSAGLTFSAPADQNWQIYSTASPPNCTPPACQYPATDALIGLVVPPYSYGSGGYTSPCPVLNDAAAKYGTSPAAILGQEKAYLAQQSITVPLLNYYSADDSLVDKFQATMMAGYEGGHPLQRTILVDRGEHAYFFDRFWQQRAILLYFKGMLGDLAVTDVPTVNMTPAGSPMSGQSQVVTATPAQAESKPAPLVCPNPTAATFASLQATRAGRTTVLRWRTSSEVGTLGFRVVREEYGRRVELGRALIPARGGTAGAVYSFRDRARAGLWGARYFIQEVRLDGSRVLHGPVRARR